MSNKLIRIPNTNSIVVARPQEGGRNDGKMGQVHPVKNKPFLFTQEEIDDITRLSPGALRKPINESEATSDVELDPRVRSVAQPADEVDDETVDDEDDNDDQTAAAPAPKPAAAPKPKPAAAAKPKPKPASDGLGGL